MKNHLGPLSVLEMTAQLGDEGLTVTIEGREEASIYRVAILDDPKPDSLFYYTGADLSQVSHLRDCVLICNPQINSVHESVTLLKTEHPRLAFIIISQRFKPAGPPLGVHPTAIVDPEAVISPTASIGPYCVLEKCRIGDHSVLQPHVYIYSNTQLGKHVTIESMSVIGSTGMGGEWGLDGTFWQMPQLAGTIIGDRCYIGASVTIDRGTVGDTRIGKFCRIMNGTNIGHNCQIGDRTFIANGIKMTGSVVVGQDCWLGAGSIYRDGVTLGDRIKVGGGAVVTKSFEQPDLVLVGVPADDKNSKNKKD